jgi:hypothetical protein
LVNEIVVESDPGGVAPGRGIADTIAPHTVDGGQTHRAGLATTVEDATAEIETLKRAAGVADGGARAARFRQRDQAWDSLLVGDQSREFEIHRIDQALVGQLQRWNRGEAQERERHERRVERATKAHRGGFQFHDFFHD